ncbi:hypothetical protein [Sphaerotilus uruguayifluvii]|uniref:Uncharacterized protein n=1 Tax=Sphaerotilus uruguayifluvii TaxID=2735897 RepID=A0ABX2FZF5_9BURK|nr:hypothetical protein [Leptothrix sp. C29]NRT55399.1 hypothetical protein [Leptothrix sp. C29]
MHPTTPSSLCSRWRAACLRGLAAAGPEGPHALVLIAPGQYLRVPISAGELARWQRQLGHKVWVDPFARPVRMCTAARGDLAGSAP